MSKVNHKHTVEYLSFIFLKSRDSKLNFREDKDEKELKNAFSYLTSLFNLTYTQCTILSLVFTFTIDDDLEKISTRRILSHFDMDNEDLFDIKDDIEILIKKGFVKQTRVERTDNLYNSYFKVNQLLIDMIFRNEEIEFEKLKNNGYTFPQFSGHMCRINRYKILKHQSREDVYNSIVEQEDRNENLREIKTLRLMIPDVKDRLVIYYLINKQVNNEETEIKTFSMIVDVYGISNSITANKQFMDKNSQVQIQGLVEMVGDSKIQLSSKSKDLFLNNQDNPDIEKVENIDTSHYYIKYDSILERKLYFNSNLQRELNILETLLRKDNFNEYQRTMRLSGNRNEGVSILLYGPSGTGKSSIVDQIAKSSKRDIFQVDLSVVRSKWWGDSEKNIKKIFTEYEEICRKSDNTSILLFNECDALLGKRNNAGDDRHDIVEATMTNLLLELFEKNKGIIIGITNLEQNLDPAFIRRFTMKYLIDKPDRNAVKSILKSKMDFLTDREIEIIANRHSLTGGMIDNILQKCTINRIITKSNPSVGEILDMCDDEIIKKNPWKEEY